MFFSENELKKWYNNKNVNPKTNRKIKENGPVYKKLEKEYESLFNGDVSDIIDINNTYYDKNNIEYKINKFLEKEKNIHLRDSRKPRVYDYKIFKNNQCTCDQIIEIKINENEYIKEDIKNILEIVKSEYNNKEIQNKYGLDYKCKIKQIDIDGNVYGFIFNSFDNNYEFPTILTHCYSNVKKKITNICIHIQYLSILNDYNDKNYDYESHVYIKY